MTNPKPCAVPGCEKPSKGRNCSMHAERLRRYGSLEKRPLPPQGKARADFVPKHPTTCIVSDCDRTSKVRGLCTTHYRRFRTEGDPGGDIAPRQPNKGKTCAVDDCDRDARERGWCQRHYVHWWETGREPDGRIISRAERAANVQYGGVHRRLERDYGFAKHLVCVDCGNQACDWSYNHTDPRPLFAKEGQQPFSRDPQHYSPRCRSCHLRMDRSLANAYADQRAA